MKRFIIYNGILLLVALAFCSCIERESLVFPEPAERTLLYYLGGSDEEVRERFDLLVAGWEQPRGQLLVYHVTDGGVAVLEEIVRENGANRVETIETYGNVNSASASVFGRVFSRARNLYPTTDFGLVLFTGSARGWLSEESSAVSRSVITDGRETLSLMDFAAALPDKGCRFILFEDSYMAGLEVGYELMDKTDYIVASASEVVAPGFVPVYGQVLKHLMENPMGLNSAAKAYYEHSGSCTVSVIHTVALWPVRNILQGLEQRVGYWEHVNREGVQVMDNLEPYHLYYDAASYVEANGTETEIAAFNEAVSQSVEVTAATQGTHCGLTLYVPDGHYPLLEAERKELSLYRY